MKEDSSSTSGSTLSLSTSETKEEDNESNKEKKEVKDEEGEKIVTLPIGDVKKIQLRMWRNVVILSLSFVLLFTAYGVVASLQSTVNNEGGLGTIAEATIYLTQIVSALFVPTWMIRKIGLKWTMVFSELCYSAYTAVQFYPTFYTMIPAAVLIGLGAAPLWTAQGVYLTQTGEKLAEILGDANAKEVHITRFFGVFYMIISTSAIWGQLISSLVLSSGAANATEITEERLSYCGANFCPQEYLNYTNSLLNNETDSDTTNSRPANIDTLNAILLGCSLASALVLALFIDAPPKKTAKEKEENKISTWKSVTATFRHIKHPYMMLLIPITLWTGLKQTFTMAEFTYAFINCALGVEQIGFILICGGAASAVGSLSAGFLVKAVGRLPVILFGSVTNLVLICVMLYAWIPDPDHPEVFYILAAISGLADSILLTQVFAFYGVIFPNDKEAAFSNQRLWNSIAFAAAFGYSTFLCVDVKLYVIISVLLAGVSGYVTIEVYEYRKSKNGIQKDLSTENKNSSVITSDSKDTVSIEKTEM